jgi:hypothetical protein
MNTNTSPIGRRLVADFLLSPGDKILNVVDGSVATTVVTTRAGWRVEPLPEICTTRTSAGYELFVAEPSATDARDPEEGFTVLPDGQAFHLNDPAQLREFYQQVTPRPAPLEVAYLIASFVAPQPAPRFLVTDEPPGPPVVTEDGPNNTRVVLFTYSWHFPNEESELRVYERWEVKLGADIEWNRTDVEV